MVLLWWCLSQPTEYVSSPETDNVISTDVIHDNRTEKASIIYNTGSSLSIADQQAIWEAHEYYNLSSVDAQRRFSDIYTMDDYAIWGLEQYLSFGDSNLYDWVYSLFVVKKFNGQWLHLYHGNSGEISCTIVSKFWFPQELLEQYGKECIDDGDFTIPQTTLEMLSQLKN